mmetsp:Transcript_18302/g.39303  ORF Transcript_18302/g.39303 Transcript_18302/m.39303 type:complete len:108 (+) Transcript_18302:78-401(+)
MLLGAGFSQRQAEAERKKRIFDAETEKEQERIDGLLERRARMKSGLLEAKKWFECEKVALETALTWGRCQLEALQGLVQTEERMGARSARKAQQKDIARKLSRRTRQ